MSNKGSGISRRSVLAAAGAMTAASLPFVRSARAQKKLDSINVIRSSGNLTAVIEELMNQQGAFAKFGLAPTTIAAADGQKILGSIISGEEDICPLSGFANIFPAVQRGAKVKLINGGVLLGQQTIVSAKPDIKSIKDLGGKTIGIGSLGAQLHQTMVALLLKNGVDPAKITWVNIGSSADVYRAVTQKTVDAGAAQIDVIPTLDKVGVHRLEGGDMWSNIPEYPFQGGFASDATIASKRDLLVRSLAAYAWTFRFLSNPGSKDAYSAARRKALSGSGAEFDESSDFQWNFFQTVKPFAQDLILSPERIAYLQELNVRTEVQTGVLPYDQVCDMSLAKEALRLL